MEERFREAVNYYRKQGAPGNQQILVALLRELQTECGGSLSAPLLRETAELLGVKESFLRAIIRRIPGLRAEEEGRVLELCVGKNCGRNRALAESAEKLCTGRDVTVRYVPCMRLCGKGPNLRWNGRVYHKADEVLLRQLLEEK